MSNTELKIESFEDKSKLFKNIFNIIIDEKETFKSKLEDYLGSLESSVSESSNYITVSGVPPMIIVKRKKTPTEIMLGNMRK